jgi:HAD superfamily hydrolase (TIGR01549 family)
MDNRLSPDALLFDMDGVLVDSVDSWWKSLNHALKTYNQQEITRDEFIEDYWGYELQDILKQLGLDEKNGVFCNNVFRNYVDEITLFSGTKQTLETLTSYPKAIITNTPRDCTIQILEKYEIKHYFDVIVTSDQIEKGKPAPDMIYEVCKRLGFKPANVVLIGDTKNDVKAAKAAGCTSIGINVIGDYTITNISDIVDLLDL